MIPTVAAAVTWALAAGASWNPIRTTNRAANNAFFFITSLPFDW
jgi:hypothetical protein